MAKRSISKGSTFSLPVLLSFNELAWISIFAMGLIAVYSIQRANIATNRQAPMVEESFLLKKNISTLNAELKDSQEKLAAKHEELEHLKNDASTTESISQKAREESERVESLLEKKTNEVRILEQKIDEISKDYFSIREFRRDKEVILGKLEQTRIENIELNQKLNVALERSSIRKELLGLRGPMKNVVLVVDRSGSMTARWQETVTIIETWLRYIPVEKCAVIAFGDGCISIPKSGMLRLDDETGDASRSFFIRELRSLPPKGLTNTTAALGIAYGYNPDTIILFTDGDPKVKDVPTSKLMRECIQLVSRPQNKKIPVNCIAVGEYYKEPYLIEFLISISKATNGSFLGRYN